MPKKKRIFVLLVVVWLLLTSVNNYTVGAESLDPLITEDANVLEPGVLQLRLGVEYLKNKDLAFDTQNGDRDVFILPSLDIALGVGKIVEVQVYFDGIYTNEEGYNDTYGVGDLRLFTKVQLKKEDVFPAVASKFGVKQPNASNEDRLGTDEFDFYSWLLFSKHLGDVSCHLNLGLGILGNPHQNSNQDDVFIYGLGLIIPATDILNLAIEVNGQTCSNYNNNFSHALVGLQIEKGTTRWDMGVSFGLTDESQDWSVKCGLTRSFENFIKF